MANIETLLADTRYFAEASAPSTPASGAFVLYVKSDGKLYGKNDAGTEVEYGAAGAAGNLQAGKVKRTSGDFTTASTSFVDVTGMSVTLTTTAKRCLVAFSAVCSINNVAGTMALTLDIDGTDQGGATAGLISVGQHATANESWNASFTFLTDVLSAASHTFKIRAKVFNAAHTGTVTATDPPAVLSVVELYAA